jgi:hypothetical protein
VPLGVEVTWTEVGGRGADVLVLPAVGGGKVAKRVGVGCVGPACSVAARAVTVMAAAVYTSGVIVWLWLEGRLQEVLPSMRMRRVAMISLLAFTFCVSL